MIVFFTILVFGGLTPFMLKWLKISDDAVGGADHHHAPEGGTYDMVEVDGEGLDIKFDDDLNIEEMRPMVAWIHRIDRE